jgi:ribonuclease HI
MESVRSVSELPPAPAVYAMYGGAGREYVAYVGLADNLRRRVKQHLVNRDSSVTTGTSAAGLNPDQIRAVEWWTDPGFSDRTTLAAAELVAFDVLQPALRSRGGITAAAQTLANDDGFRGRIKTLLGTPSGRLDIPQLMDVIERLAELEARIALLEADPVGVEEKSSDVEDRTRKPGLPKARKKGSASFTIYADGSGTTGGPAGIGFVVLSDGLPFKEGSAPLKDATNQQAELLAATHALDSLPEGQDVVLYSDSRYVVTGFTKVGGAGEYLPEWRARGWRTGSGGAVANLHLWQGLIAAVERHGNVRFKWMRAHVVKCPTCSHNGADRITNTEDGYEASCGDEWHDHAEGNQRADRLAGEARKAARLASESSRS